MKHSERNRPSIAPFLSVWRGVDAIEFYKAAFGATELHRLGESGKSVAAQLALGSADFWLAGESLEYGNFQPGNVRRRYGADGDGCRGPGCDVRAGNRSGSYRGLPGTDELYSWRVGTGQIRSDTIGKSDTRSIPPRSDTLSAMKLCWRLSTALLFAMTLLPAAPVNLIFDTDMGNDIDDTLALAMIHALVSKGEARLLAVTTTKDNWQAGPAVDVLNTFYARPQIPIGVVKDGKTPEDSRILSVPLAEKLAGGAPVFPHRLTDGRNAPDAVSVLRTTLIDQPDGSVTLVQVGFSTNLARLLKTDEPLIRKKVKLLVAMAGNFARPKPEYNVYTDVPAAKEVFENWPSPIVMSGFEIGERILYPAKSIEEDYRYVPHHPVADAYRAYRKMPYNRPSWDLTAVFYAVRPESGYLTLSEPGRIAVDDKGNTKFMPSPDGGARYLRLSNSGARRQLVRQFCQLASQPPDHY